MTPPASPEAAAPAAADGVPRLHRRSHLDALEPGAVYVHPEGFYARARRGEIPGLTGVSSPYQAPERPELAVRADRESAHERGAPLLGLLREHGVPGEIHGR